MVRLKPLSQRRVIKILEDNGFKRVRSNKHITFKHPIKKVNGHIATTWVPHSNEITVFVISHIIRQTGKPPEEFR